MFVLFLLTTVHRRDDVIPRQSLTRPIKTIDCANFGFYSSSAISQRLICLLSATKRYRKMELACRIYNILGLLNVRFREKFRQSGIGRTRKFLKRRGQTKSDNRLAVQVGLVIPYFTLIKGTAPPETFGKCPSHFSIAMR
jgi:hypothetical protein